MPAKPTLLLSPNGSFDANGRVAPTISGAVRTVNGGWFVEEGTTNVLTNPSFETGTVGWNVTGKRVTSDGAVGGACVELTAPQQVNTNNAKIPVSAGQTWTLSFYAKSTAGTRVCTLYLSQWTAANAISNTVQAFTFTDTWARYEQTVTIAPGNVSLSFTIQASGTGTVARFDAFQLEQKSYATSYTDGSLGAGHAWTGTPHASSSTRAEGDVYLPPGYADIDKGSVLVRFNLQAPIGRRRSIVAVGVQSTDTADTTNNVFTPIARGGAASDYVLRRRGNNNDLAQSSLLYEPRVLYFGWTPDEQEFWVDGEAGKSASARAGYSGDFLRSITLGNSGNPANPFTLNGLVESVVIFDDVLTDAEIAEYMAMDVWTWGNTFAPYVTPVYPSYTSSVFTIEPVVYKTDRFNTVRDDITTSITRISIDGDKERSGSKLACSVEAFREVLGDGDWIAPYLRVTRESGEDTLDPMGHYRIDPPTISYDARGNPSVTATGVDFLDVLSRIKLTSTFFSPKGIDPIQDIRTLLMMATRSYVSQNLVQNPSFEAQPVTGQPSAWSTPAFSNGGTGIFHDLTAGYDIPSGSKVWAAAFNASQPAGAKATMYQDVTITPDMIGRKVWVSGVWLPGHADHRSYLTVQFYDAGNVLIPNTEIKTVETIRQANRWVRENAYGDIPLNAAKARVTITVIDAVGGFPSQRRSAWDDVVLHTFVGDPVPAHMISLPPFAGATTATTQSIPPATYLEAMNELAVVAGNNEMFASLDGRLMVNPIADLERGFVSRSYTENDIRIVSQFQIALAAIDRFNIIQAIKEDAETGEFLLAEAVNDDPSDPFSTVNYGPVSDPIVVSDAVDLPELQKIARRRLAEASTQEELTFSILPDSKLMFNDIIEIRSNTRANGRWEVYAISWGTDTSNPLVDIRARRVLKRIAP